MDSAYLFTDSRYWLQADEEVGKNWTIIRAGASGAQDDWVEWIVVS
jgi:Xaa-Pro aminopeptidase